MRYASWKFKLETGHLNSQPDGIDENLMNTEKNNYNSLPLSIRAYSEQRHCFIIKLEDVILIKINWITKLLGCNVIISKWLWFTIHNHRITIVCGSVSRVTKTLSLIEQSNQTLEYLYYINTGTFAGLIGLLTEGDSSRADDCWAIAKIELWNFLHNNGMRGLIHCPIPLSVMPYHACNAVEWCGSAKMTIDCVLPIQSHNQWNFEKKMVAWLRKTRRKQDIGWHFYLWPIKISMIYL